MQKSTHRITSAHSSFRSICISRQKHRVFFKCTLAATLPELRRPHAALSFLNSCTRTTIDPKRLFAVRIAIAQCLNDERRGEEAYQKLVELLLHNPAVYMHFGDYYGRKGELENPMRTFERAIATTRASSNAFYVHLM